MALDIVLVFSCCLRITTNVATSNNAHFNGDRISFGEDEETLEMDSDDGCTAM